MRRSKSQRLGYVRVSSFDQNPERQLEDIKVDKTFTDKASGKDVHRPQLDALKSFAREGDTIIIHSMDRLARNLDDLRGLVVATCNHNRSGPQSSQFWDQNKCNYPVV